MKHLYTIATMFAIGFVMFICVTFPVIFYGILITVFLGGIYLAIYQFFAGDDNSRLHYEMETERYDRGKIERMKQEAEELLKNLQDAKRNGDVDGSQHKNVPPKTVE